MLMINTLQKYIFFLIQPNIYCNFNYKLCNKVCYKD